MGITSGPLVTAGWLRAHLDDPELRILDVRWTITDGADRGGYLAGHIPGARFVDLDVELAGTPGPAGRHPLPSAEQFSDAMRGAGVSEDSRVVAYDGGTGAAARAWWLLRAAGHAWVAVLDGGITDWIASAGELRSGEEPDTAGDFEAKAFRGWVSADQTADLVGSGAIVVDARTRDRFAGGPSPYDPRPGHIPGARSHPWTEAYRNGYVLPRQEMATRSAEATGDRAPAAAYCGSGVTACALILALESAGIGGVLLYPGSWSEWAQDPERPVELGP
jgi:thiosulfate/3-mercaptopyruvate sulfurtransferase